MEIRITLCPNCDACPEVKITEECVCIGEAENKVRLTHAEWNQLVELVRRGELGVVGQEQR
jgi:hypothetical protein